MPRLSSLSARFLPRPSRVRLSAVLAVAASFACTQVEYITPTVVGVARQDGTVAPTPRPLCDVLPESGLVGISVLGSGFVAEILQANKPQPLYLMPSVLFEGPGASYPGFNIHVVNGGQIDLILADPRVQSRPPLVDGIYSVTVTNPEESLYHVQAHARLANALQILPSPVITSVSPPSVCLQAPATVVFRGGPFSPGIRIRTDTVNQTGPLTVRVDGPDQLTVTFPAGIFGSDFSLVFDDGAGCSVGATVKVACP